MAKKASGGVSVWSFWIGAVLSILVGIGAAAAADFASNPWIPAVLVILGLIVGFANVSTRETLSFLVAALAIFVFASVFAQVTVPSLVWLANLLGSAVQAFGLFIGAAAVVVAVREAWNLAAE